MKSGVLNGNGVSGGDATTQEVEGVLENWPVNSVELVGTVEGRRRGRDTEPELRRIRSPGGKQALAGQLVISEGWGDGEVSWMDVVSVPFHVLQGAPGVEVLCHGTRVRIRGRLARERVVDTRYTGIPGGLVTTQLRVEGYGVESVSEPEADRAIVRLTVMVDRVGRVNMPERVTRRRRHNGFLRVEQRVPRRNGSRAVEIVEEILPFVVPAKVEQASWLLRRGNTARIEGRIVNSVTELDADHAWLQGIADEHMRRRLRTLVQPRVEVLYVEPLSGAGVTDEEIMLLAEGHSPPNTRGRDRDGEQMGSAPAIPPDIHNA